MREKKQWRKGENEQLLHKLLKWPTFAQDVKVRALAPSFRVETFAANLESVNFICIPDKCDFTQSEILFKCRALMGKTKISAETDQVRKEVFTEASHIEVKT